LIGSTPKYGRVDLAPQLLPIQKTADAENAEYLQEKIADIQKVLRITESLITLRLKGNVNR